jgi:hypothetical protein
MNYHSPELLEACAGIPRPGGPARFVRLFQPRFADLVERGEKRQTIRPIPKRIPRVGDRLSLRAWTGKPYRSKQRVLREAKVISIKIFSMSDAGISLWTGGYWEYTTDPNAFAQADGFKNLAEMREWFRRDHGLPFEGIAIWWE